MRKGGRSRLAGHHPISQQPTDAGCCRDSNPSWIPVNKSGRTPLPAIWRVCGKSPDGVRFWLTQKTRKDLKF